MSEPVFGEWQPIETAPMNPEGECFGPYILVWDELNGVPIVVQWSFKDFEGGWAYNWYSDDAPVFIDHEGATHWMPLPDIPEAD